MPKKSKSRKLKKVKAPTGRIPSIGTLQKQKQAIARREVSRAGTTKKDTLTYDLSTYARRKVRKVKV